LGGNYRKANVTFAMNFSFYRVAALLA